MRTSIQRSGFSGFFRGTEENRNGATLPRQEVRPTVPAKAEIVRIARNIGE
jgi:hypothetical protein